MRMLLAVVVTCALMSGGPAAADGDPPCTDAICPIPGGPSSEPQAPTFAPDMSGPPRAPVQGMRHPTNPGPGHDVRPCVSTREYRSARFDIPKRELEERWDVVGRGRLRDVISVGNAWTYPRCGFVRQSNRVFFAVVYDHGLVTGLASVS